MIRRTEFVGQALENKGHTVVAVRDGAEALGALKRGAFDLLISDITMPIMDGLKLVSMVRKDVNHKDIPIIIITTEGAQEDRQRALALGANAYITKPIQAPQIIKTVKELLKL